MKPLDLLIKGLTMLRHQVQERKAKLTTELKAGWSISDADEVWLDGEGNLVDEERVVEVLKNAHDYEQCIMQLSPLDEMIIQRLQDLAQGHGAILPPKKRKRICLIIHAFSVCSFHVKYRF